MHVIPRVDQLRVHPHFAAHALHAAFQQIRDAKLLTDLSQIARRAAPVLEDRSAADDLQIRDFCQISENLILHAIREVGVLLVVAEVFERQDSN